MYNNEQEFLENTEVQALLKDTSDLLKVLSINLDNLIKTHEGSPEHLVENLKKITEHFSAIDESTLDEEGGEGSNVMGRLIMSNLNTARLLSGIIAFQEAQKENIEIIDKCMY